MFKRLLSILLAMSLLAALSLNAFAVTEDSSGDSEDGDTVDETSAVDYLAYDVSTGFPAMRKFSVEGTSALLCSMDSDMILYAQDIDERISPGPLAKVMTCLVAIENSNLDDMVTVSQNAMAVTVGWSGELTSGEEVSMRDLLYMIMLISANEACNVVGEYVSGTIDGFVDLLNQKAEELGMVNTHFSNTHGQVDSEEYTTTRDLMIMTKAALANEQLAEICYATIYQRPASNYHEAHKIYTTNYIAAKDTVSRYIYSYAKGVKAGYASKAGYSCITTGDNGEIRLIAIVTGCKGTSLTNGETYMKNFVEAKSLLEYGFSNFEYLSVFRADHAVGEVSLSGGDAQNIVVAAMSDGGLALPSDYLASDVTIEVSGSATAPVTPGDVVGTASVYYRGNLITTVNVTPISNAEKAAVATDETVNEDTPAAITRDTGDSHFSIVLIILVAALVLLLFYLFIYLYSNIQRSKARKARAKRRRSAARAGQPVRRSTVRSEAVRRSSDTSRNTTRRGSSSGKQVHHER